MNLLYRIFHVLQFLHAFTVSALDSIAELNSTRLWSSDLNWMILLERREDIVMWKYHV